MQQLKLKQLELGKIGTEKASPDKFNFYVVLAGLVMTRSMTLARLASADAILEHHHYRKTTKAEGPSENMGFNGKCLKVSDKKRTGILFSTSEKTLMVHQDHKAIN